MLIQPSRRASPSIVIQVGFHSSTMSMTRPMKIQLKPPLSMSKECSVQMPRFRLPSVYREAWGLWQVRLSQRCRFINTHGGPHACRHTQTHMRTYRAQIRTRAHPFTHTPDTHAYTKTRTNTHTGTPIHPRTHIPTHTHTIKHHTSIHAHMLKTLRTDLVDVFDKDRVLIGREHLHGVPVG